MARKRFPLKADLPPARFDFAGHSFIIVDRTALFWPAQSALLVADLHLEKGSWFAARGQMLPPYDSLATLERLTAIVRSTGAARIWALGDNFHDDQGPERMAPEIRARLAVLAQACALHWITGNHDEVLPEDLPGDVVDEVQIDGILLRHRAEVECKEPEISGHWHPKHGVTVRGRRLVRPCFVVSAQRLILPAFGAYAGGMAAHEPAIMTLMRGPVSVLIAGAKGVARFPLTTP